MKDKVLDKKILDEGERMVPAFHKGLLIYGEHLSRYESVLPIVKSKIVLDIASGAGYGSHLISASAKQVIGVDINHDAIAYAKKNYSGPNIKYLQGSAEKIPLDSNSVDVVVSFETIEHIRDFKKFLDEIKRVVKADGVVVMSTPNNIEFSKSNPFHLHEFSENELSSLLKKYFKHIDFLYQFTWLQAAVIDSKKALLDSEPFTLDTINYAPTDKSEAVYLIAICTNNDKKIAAREIGALAEHYSTRKQLEERKKLIEEIDRIKYTVGQQAAQLRQQDKTIENLQSELRAIYLSKSWRLARKLSRLYRTTLRRKN